MEAFSHREQLLCYIKYLLLQEECHHDWDKLNRTYQYLITGGEWKANENLDWFIESRHYEENYDAIFLSDKFLEHLGNYNQSEVKAEIEQNIDLEQEKYDELWWFTLRLHCKSDKQNKFEDVNLIAQKHIVETHDGAELRTLEIGWQDENGCVDIKRPYSINFVGNAMSCEDAFNCMFDQAINLECNVIGFNHRGVMGSKGKPKSKDDLVIDGIAQVQRLLDLGVRPEDITLDGFSLGGGIATLVAKHFHDRGIRVKLFNDRSFSTLTNVVVGWIRTYSSDENQRTAYSETTFKKILGGIAYPFIKSVLVLTGYEINAASAYQAIPDEYKEHLVVKPSKNDKEKNDKGDSTITKYASVHASLKVHCARQFYHETKKLIEQYKQHELNAEELATRQREIRTQQKNKNRKMVSSEPAKDAHCASRLKLESRGTCGMNARDFFAAFFKKKVAQQSIEDGLNRRKETSFSRP